MGDELYGVRAEDVLASLEARREKSRAARRDAVAAMQTKQAAFSESNTSESNVSGADRAADRAGFDPAGSGSGSREDGLAAREAAARRLVRRGRGRRARRTAPPWVGRYGRSRASLSAGSSGAAGADGRTALHAWHLETTHPSDGRVPPRHGHARGHADCAPFGLSHAPVTLGAPETRAPPRWPAEARAASGKKRRFDELELELSGRDGCQSKSCAFAERESGGAQTCQTYYVCSFRAFVGSLGTGSARVNPCLRRRSCATPRLASRGVSSRPLVVTRFCRPASSSPAPRCRRRRCPSERNNDVSRSPRLVAHRGEHLLRGGPFARGGAARVVRQRSLTRARAPDALRPSAGGDRPSVVLRVGERDGPAAPTQPRR